MLLVYTTNSRLGEAEAAAREHCERGEPFAVRNAKYWLTSGPEVRASEVAVRRVLVLEGVPHAEEIVSAYAECGIKGAVLGGGGLEAPPPLPTSKPEPWPIPKRPPDAYLAQWPNGPNADLATRWLDYLASNPGAEIECAD